MQLRNTKLIPATRRAGHTLRLPTSEHLGQNSQLVKLSPTFFYKSSCYDTFDPHNVSDFSFHPKIFINPLLTEKTHRWYQIHVFSFEYLQ